MLQEKTQLDAVLDRLSLRRRTPTSTYRVQLFKEFGFREAQGIVPYLMDLGVTDFYSSPILKAQPGSTHGYDITDHNKLNPELGTEADFERFTSTLAASGMGLILDFVPNHMGINPQTNPWWHDVLENGQSSPYAKYFDIRWDPIKPQLRHKVLLPVLGDLYGVVLERGELQLSFANGAFSVRYFDYVFPIDPKQYPMILRHNLAPPESPASTSDHETQEFLSIMTAFENLPAHTETDPKRIVERQRESKVAKERLERLVQKSKRYREHVHQAVQSMNGIPGDARSFDPLHALLEAQAYRLAYWRTAFHEINYRRFFDINSLASLRVENESVFPSTHRLIMHYIAEDKITGLRIDHPDGLYDPAHYFEMLQETFLETWATRALGKLSDADREGIRAWRTAERKRDPKGLAARPLYIVAEKVLSQGEVLDPHWAIDGTSGYDFLNDVNNLFLDPRHANRMRDIYVQFTGKTIPYDVVAYVSKKLIMSTALAGDLNVLAYALDEITERDRRSRDFTLDSLRDALKEVIASYPVYRTYINASRTGVMDRQIIEAAISEARGRNRMLEPAIFDFIRSVLLPENVEKVSSEEFRRQLSFTMKFQQLTGPVQAKGSEDTAFYRYNLLISQNEVGGDPSQFGSTPEAFHEANYHRSMEWKHTMLASSTHDTKRGEDARARLDALSEIPAEWEAHAMAWAKINGPLRARLGKEWAPDRNDEYLFYQSLLGAWAWERQGAPFDQLRERMQGFMMKAIKESKLNTSWLSPNEPYEQAVMHFVQEIFSDGNAFWDSFAPFAERVAYLGMRNSLSQLILKLASPGVPDFYQGAELWDLSMVDPDNRRPVDFQKRRELLTVIQRRALSRANLESLLEHWQDGGIKLFMTQVGLRFRREHPELFFYGDYQPLQFSGTGKDQMVGFVRSYENHKLIALASRLTASSSGWGNTAIRPEESWKGLRFRHLFTGEDVEVPFTLSEILGTSPAALLYAE